MQFLIMKELVQTDGFIMAQEMRLYIFYFFKTIWGIDLFYQINISQEIKWF